MSISLVNKYTFIFDNYIINRIQTNVILIVYKNILTVIIVFNILFLFFSVSLLLLFIKKSTLKPPQWQL